MNRTSANYAPLTPVSFLGRAATVYPDKAAVIHGERTYSYREFHQRACRLASALSRARHWPRRYGRGDGAKRAGYVRGTLRGADAGGPC